MNINGQSGLALVATLLAIIRYFDLYRTISMWMNFLFYCLRDSVCPNVQRTNMSESHEKYILTSSNHYPIMDKSKECFFF